MHLINIFFYYVFYCSVVIFYGIGLNRSVLISARLRKSIFVRTFVLTLTALFCVVVSFFLCNYVLSLFSLTTLYPIFSFLIFALSVFLSKMIFGKSSEISSRDFALTYLVVLLALSESIFVLDAVIIVLSSSLAFIFLLIVLSSLYERMDILRRGTNSVTIKSALTFALAVLAISLVAWNISWLR